MYFPVHLITVLSRITRSVCDKHLPIDANVLCHIVELLCAAFVIGRRLRIRASLHDITMSRRLLARLCTNEKLKEQESHMLKLLVTLMCALLREMYTGTSGQYDPIQNS